MKKIYLVGTPGKKDIEQAITKVEAQIATSFDIVGIDCDEKTDLTTIVTDYIMVFGGDGTILGAAHRLEGREIPLIGINLGTLGFLTEATLQELPQVLEHLLKQTYIIAKRSLLHWELLSDTGSTKGYGLNELALRRCNRSPLFSAEVSIDGSTLTTYKGDGLLVATPTGSTAYNLSAQGPLLESTLDAFIITPLHSHSITHRPIVVSDNRVIDIKALSPNLAVELCIDGREAISIDTNTTIRIQKTSRKVLFIELSLHSHYEKIRAKLGWGL